MKSILLQSEVLKAESVFPKEGPLGKPNPFSYIATLYGNNERDYLHYIQNQTHIVNEDDVFIVGDSLADLLCAKDWGNIYRYFNWFKWGRSKRRARATW